MSIKSAQWKSLFITSSTERLKYQSVQDKMCVSYFVKKHILQMLIAFKKSYGR